MGPPEADLAEVTRSLTAARALRRAIDSSPQGQVLVALLGVREDLVGKPLGTRRSVAAGLVGVTPESFRVRRERELLDELTRALMIELAAAYQTAGDRSERDSRFDPDSEQIHKSLAALDGQLVMPFYIVCDVSYSMSDDMPQLNEALQHFRNTILSEPAIDDVARIAIITFSDGAQIDVPLGRLSETAFPLLRARAGTNYGAAFQMLAQTIESDRLRLKSEGYRIYRPCAFFLTDGEPLDSDWEQTFRATLTYDPASGEGMKAHPIFVPLGFRDAEESILEQLVYPQGRSRWYLATSVSASDALTDLTSTIQQTVITSRRLASRGVRAPLQLPEPAAGSAIASGNAAYDPDLL